MKLIENLGLLYPTLNSTKKYRYGIFECQCCFKRYKMQTRQNKNDICKSCYQRSIFKHKMSGTKLYNVYNSMKQRCLNKNNKQFEDYGEKGITIYYEWLEDFMNFYNWAINNGYKDGLSIDRIDPYGNYEPNNCRWTTKTKQARNIRRIQKNNTSGYIGVYFIKKDNNYFSSISIDGEKIYIHSSKDKIECAYKRDLYIDEHNLEHTKNFKRIKI